MFKQLYLFKYFKDSPPQISPSPFLITLLHLHFIFLVFFHIPNAGKSDKDY